MKMLLLPVVLLEREPRKTFEPPVVLVQLARLEFLRPQAGKPLEILQGTRGLPHQQPGRAVKGHDPGDGCFPVQNNDLMAAPDGPEMLAQAALEFGDSNLDDQ